jgi:hypothetical protein
MGHGQGEKIAAVVVGLTTGLRGWYEVVKISIHCRPDVARTARSDIVVSLEKWGL